jgi:GNAT superfamily N-acetyltransferase
MESFPDFFLTFLGPRFLREFYNSFTYDEAGIGFVAIDEDNGKVVGVIVGPLEPQGYFKRLLKRRWWAFCLASATAVLKHPIIVKRLFRALFYRGEPPPGTKRALLSSIAVLPQLQGRGVGQALIKRWMEEVKQRGGNGCFLTTDAINNDKINNFYQKLGWKVESTYTTPEGRVMNRYVFDFR